MMSTIRLGLYQIRCLIMVTHHVHQDNPSDADLISDIVGIVDVWRRGYKIELDQGQSCVDVYNKSCRNNVEVIGARGVM